MLTSLNGIIIEPNHHSVEPSISRIITQRNHFISIISGLLMKRRLDDLYDDYCSEKSFNYKNNH